MMKFAALMFGLFSSISQAGVFSSVDLQAYPADWPVLTGMSGNCSEVQGTFIDQNSWRWEHEEKPGTPLGIKNRGTREAAWIVFQLSADDVRSEEPQVKSRLFDVIVNQDQTITIKYTIDGKIVASKKFTKDKLTCSKDGLTITTLESSGVILDKLPNKGVEKRQSTIYRMQDYLYVKTEYVTKVKVMRVIPQSSVYVAWFRFKAQQR